MTFTFAIQCRDLDEGNGALWYDLSTVTYSTRAEAREMIDHFRKMDEDSGFESLITFRIVEVGSAEYYSQPTDALEY